MNSHLEVKEIFSLCAKRKKKRKKEREKKRKRKDSLFFVSLSPSPFLLSMTRINTKKWAMEYIKRQNLDVVLVGDSGAGKSTIFQNLCYQPLDSSPSSPIAPHDASKQEGTLGVNYYVKEITGHDKKTTAKITLWDTPGKEMYINVSEVYIQTAHSPSLRISLTSSSFGECSPASVALPRRPFAWW